MRKIILGSVLVVLLAGCDKDYTPGPVAEERNPLQGSLTYDLNGEQIVADYKFAAIQVDEETDIMTLVISGERFSDNKVIERSDVLTMTINYYEGRKIYTTDDYISANLRLGSRFYPPYDEADLKNYILLPVDSSNEEEVTEFINIETDGDVFKGKFAFKMVYINPTNTSQRDTIHIENGVFDIPK